MVRNLSKVNKKGTGVTVNNYSPKKITPGVIITREKSTPGVIFSWEKFTPTWKKVLPWDQFYFELGSTFFPVKILSFEDIPLHIHGGQNRPHFFSKIRAEKNGRCNTDSPRLLIDYWETKLLQQNNVSFM